MISERQILDGESLSGGQKATGQKGQIRNYCPCRYNQLDTRCNFIDYPNLRSHIYEAEVGEYDEVPKFRDMIFNAHWAYISHEAAKNEGLEAWRRQDEKKVRRHAGHELGAREFTLTYSPQWCDDATARELMIRAVERIMKYYRNQICELEVVGEITKSGQSHIHGYYLLDGGLKITDKNFKRAYKFWNPKKKIGRGHEGGHHEIVKAESDFKGYIDKDRLTAWYEFSYLRDEHNNASRSEEDSAKSNESDASSGGEEST